MQGLSFPGLFGNNGYHYRHNRRIYDRNRMDVTVTSSDLKQVRKDDFDHIRLMVDPQYLGVLADGHIDPDRIAPFGNNHATDDLVSTRLQVLKDFIQLANDEDLGVIIQFNCDFLSAEQYLKEFNDETTSIDNSTWMTQAEKDDFKSRRIPPAQYPGPFRRDFMYATSMAQATNANQPLTRFWREFLTLTGIHKDFSPGMVIFEVASEPLTNASPQWIPINGLNGISWWNAYLPSATTYWRALQRQAISTIHQKSSSFFVIETSAHSLPWDFYSYKKRYELQPWFLSANDDVAPVFSGLEPPGANIRTDRILYAPHFYHPFHFTHREDARSYNPLVDFSGRNSLQLPAIPDTDGDPNGTTQEEKLGRKYDYMLKEFNLVMGALTVGSHIITHTAPTTYLPFVQRVEQTYQLDGPIPIIWSEFGAVIKDYNGNLFDLKIEVQGNSVLSSNPPSQRFPDGRVEWHHDAVKLFGGQSFGVPCPQQAWTAFAYKGAFGLYGKRLNDSYGSHPVLRSTETPDSPELSEEFKEALFGQ